MNIIILDDTLTQQSLVSHFIKLSFRRNFNGEGGFELHVNMNEKNADELTEGRFVYLDNKRCGIIESVEKYSQEDKRSEIMVVYGIEIKDIIKRRITVPPSGSSYETYTGQTTEYIVRSLLNSHIINPADSGRQISIFDLGQTHGIGSSRDFSTRFKNLQYEIYKLLDLDQFGLSCEVDLSAKTASFQVREGLDRSVDQSTNHSALFSLKMGTAYQSAVTQEAYSHRNLAYVGGGGGGTERTIIQVPQTSAPSGLLRREVFLDERDALTESELISRGETAIIGYSKDYSVEAAVNASGNMEYSLGDMATVMDYRNGSYENLRIVGITEIYEGTNPAKRNLTFGRVPMSMSEAINSRFFELNNILTQ